MIKILICGEGPTDCGRDNPEQADGPIQIYMKKIAEDKDLSFEKYDRKHSGSQSNIRHIQGRGKLKGHAVKCRLMTLDAISREFDVAAFYVDTDKPTAGSNTSKRACEKRFQELKENIEEGFEAANSNGNIKTIAIVPCKMIESWLMGDPAAFDKTFERSPKGKNRPQFPVNPELEWGDSQEPTSNFPKNRLARILHAYYALPGQEIFCELARNADLNTMRRNCQISFDPFYREFTGLIESF